jgi:hypothetical protein
MIALDIIAQRVRVLRPSRLPADARFAEWLKSKFAK